MIYHGYNQEEGCRPRNTTPYTPKPPAESRSKEYKAWRNIRARCYDRRDKAYAYYGGRGVIMCERWRRNYVAFLSDVGRAPSPEHSIGRIDNDGNYEPGNVRWETRLEQRANRRRLEHRSDCDGTCHRPGLCGAPVVVRGRAGRPRGHAMGSRP